MRPATPTEGGSLIRGNLFVFGAVLLGAALRLYLLRDQILINDEWHAIHAMLSQEPAQLLTRFGSSDYTIPLTAYYLLAAHTLGLSEWLMRLPLLVAGVLTVGVLPILARPYVGRATANLFAVMLAISPILTFFSRHARPYAIVLLASVCALLFFQRWWDEDDRRFGWGYGLSVLVCGAFQLVTLPFALAPFPYYLLRSLPRGAASRANLARLVRLGALIALSLVVMLAVPILLSTESLSARLGVGAFKPGAWRNAAIVSLGAAGPGLAVVVGGLALVGLVALLRKRQELHRILLFACGLQVVGLLVAAPHSFDSFFILARYLLPLTPVVLLFACAGLVAALGLVPRRHHGRRVATFAAATVLCVTLFLNGPLPRVLQAPNSWMTASMHAFWLGGRWQPKIRRMRPVPGFYRWLERQAPEQFTLVEAPWNLVASSNHFPVYQRLHRQSMLIGFTRGLCSKVTAGEAPMGAAWLDLRNFVHLADFDALRARGIDFVVLHKKLGEESKRAQAWIPARDMSGCISAYRSHYGEPFFEDDLIVAFAVADAPPEAPDWSRLVPHE